MIRTPPLSTLYLDSSGFCVTRIGFGAWAIDGSGWSFGWGQEDDGDSITAMRNALDLGVGWIDAAAVVEAHAGRIWAESSVGVGSTFYFTLPAVSQRNEDLQLANTSAKDALASYPA